MKIPQQEYCIRCKKQLQPPQHWSCPSCYHMLMEQLGGREVRSLIKTEVLPELVAFVRCRRDERLRTAFRCGGAFAFSAPVSDLSSKDRLRKQISKEKEVWRERRRLEGELKQAGAGADTAVTFLCLVLDAITTRRWMRCYLRSRFRYDIKRQEWLRGRRVPSTRYDLWVMMNAAQTYMLWDFTFKHGLAAILTARVASKDAHVTMNEAIAAMFEVHTRLSVLALGNMMMTGPHSDLHETAAVRLAGWVRTQISLLYPRLLAAMAEHADWPEDALLDLLPGAVVGAWCERAEDEPLREFVNRVARFLEDEGRPKVQIRDPRSGKVILRAWEELDDPIKQQPELPEQSFMLREEAQVLIRQLQRFSDE